MKDYGLVYSAYCGKYVVICIAKMIPSYQSKAWDTSAFVISVLHVWQMSLKFISIQL